MLEISPAESTDGTATLRWQTKDGAAVVIERSRNADFSDARILYRGNDTASTVTGLSDGKYFFRGRLADAAAGAWSKPVKLAVTHHPLSRAFSFFLLGVVVFAATVALILTGGRAVEKGL